MKVGDRVFQAYVDEISNKVVVAQTTLVQVSKAYWYLADRLQGWGYRQQVPVGCGFTAESDALKALHADLQEAEKAAERTLLKTRRRKEEVGGMIVTRGFGKALEHLTGKKS